MQNSPVYRISPDDPHGGWKIQLEESQKILGRYPELESTIDMALCISQAHPDARVRVLDRDGSVLRDITPSSIDSESEPAEEKVTAQD